MVQADQPRDRPEEAQLFIARYEQCELFAQETWEQVPGAEEKRTAAKIERLHKLKEGIDQLITTAQQMLNQAIQRIKDNLKTDDNPEGLLTAAEQEYSRCLQLKKDELKVLFGQDEEHWNAEHERAKKHAEQLRAQLLAMIEKVRGQINTVFESIPAQPKQLYALRRLPLLGYQAPDSELNFEWPQMLFEGIENVSLASIELKEHGHSIGSVRCILSDGQQSPTFDKYGCEGNNPQTINFDRRAPIRSVRCRVHNNGSVSAILSVLQFLDAASNKVHVYNPRKQGEADMQDAQIEENEQLIGVYGSYRTRDQFIRSLGFIVKVKLAT